MHAEHRTTALPTQTHSEKQMQSQNKIKDYSQFQQYIYHGSQHNNANINTSTDKHINTSKHQHINTSTQVNTVIKTSTQSSTHQHKSTLTSKHQHINTSTCP